MERDIKVRKTGRGGREKSSKKSNVPRWFKKRMLSIYDVASAYLDGWFGLYLFNPSSLDDRG